MGKRPLFFLLVILMWAAACRPEAVINSGPRLVQEVTLRFSTMTPTRVLSPTPRPVIAAPTAHLFSPLEVDTLESDFVLVTPTLPPSKTPTRTPTPTQTPTATATIGPQFATSVIIPVTIGVGNPLPQVCNNTWFFVQIRPASCPLNPPNVGQGAYQQFQNGYMLWVRSQDAIYVFLNDPQLPRWQVFQDSYEDGMPEDDPAYSEAPAPGLWQPRRGFGIIWRSNPSVQQRIGWATQQWETPYSVNVQTAGDGMIFIGDPNGGVFSLYPGGTNWQFFGGF